MKGFLYINQHIPYIPNTMSSSPSTLSFNVSVPTDIQDLLAFMTFCRKRQFTFPKGYDVTSVGNVYYRQIAEITSIALMNAHGKSGSAEILDHILFRAEEELAHWEDEFICYESDRPEVAAIEAEYKKSVEHLNKAKALQADVLRAED